jgi:predicted pyridoxine 5'-phosphate oxidase superfamily flavin-nucleotide-binding protein
MSKFYRGSSIDASYQVSVNLAKRFQRRRFFRNQPIRNKNCLWRPCHGRHRQFLFLIGRFLKGYSPLEPLCQMNRSSVGSIYGRSSIKNAHFVSIRKQTWKRFERRRILKNWPIRKKNCMWRPCLLAYQDEICNLYRGLYIHVHASYPVSVHVAKRFERKRFRKHLWHILYKGFSFCSDSLTNMAATDNSCFWLVDF